MTIDVESEMAELLQRAVDGIEELADRYRARVLIPFCRRRRYTYLAGNGIWGFYRVRPGEQHGETVDEDELPRDIADALNTEGVGRDDCLGFYVRDITREDTASRRRP